MKKLMTILAIAVMTLMACSCKNSCKKAECSDCDCCTECVEEKTGCCGDHEGGVCTKPDSEKCAKCLEAAKAAAEEAAK